MGSLLDTIKTNVVSLFGNNNKPKSNEEAVLGYQPNISPLPPVPQAGDASTTGESVASDVAVDNTGTLGGTMATDVSTTTTTPPAPPVVTPTMPPAQPQAPTGNTYSFEGDKEAKGTSGDVKSQAMYDLAQEALSRGDMRGAEAILRRPLTNQDYFPGPGLQQARTAWGDPLFTGAGQLFPMAVMDARQKAMAEAEAMAMREEALNFEIPKIEVAGLRSNYSQTFVSDAEKFVADGIAKYGSRRNAIRELKRSGEWAKFMADHKATADAINYTGKEAQTFLKNAQDGQIKGETYASPEALAAAQAYLLGLKEWGSKQINNTQLNQLAEQFHVWESWDKYEKESRSRIKPTEISTADILAQQHASNPSPQDIQAYEAVKMELPEGSRDMKVWLYNKKISEVLAPQIMNAVIEPFFASNPSAVQQFQARYPGKDIEEIKRLVAEQYAMGYGRQVDMDKVVQTPKGSVRVTSGGGKTPDKTFYQSIQERMPEIINQVNQVKPENEAQAKANAEQIFGGGTADDLIFGIRAFDWPTINQSISSMPYSELYEPNASEFNKKQTVYFDRVNKATGGIPSGETTAKALKVQGVINGFAVKGKDGQYRVYSNKDAVDMPLTADYKPYLIQVVTDQRYESGVDVDALDFPSLMAKQTKAPKSGIFFRFVPFDKSTATTFDKVADKASQSTGGTEATTIEVESDQEDFR